MNSSFNEHAYSTHDPMVDNLSRAYAACKPYSNNRCQPHAAAARLTGIIRVRADRQTAEYINNCLYLQYSNVDNDDIASLKPIKALTRGQGLEGCTLSLKIRGQPPRAELRLAAQTQTTDQGRVTLNILRLQVVQQLTTLVYHPDQTTT
ncbi:MAG: hypothetical protein ACI9W6_002160 [Motiliproteus sp.]|jgi:hypothetical protein